MPTSEVGDKKTSYHIYALRIKDFSEEQRDAMIEEISKKDVAVNVHFIPMPMLSFFKQLGYNIEDYQVAYNNYKHEISLPIYPHSTKAHVHHVVESVIEAYDKVRPR